MDLIPSHRFSPSTTLGFNSHSIPLVLCNPNQHKPELFTITDPLSVSIHPQFATMENYEEAFKVSRENIINRLVDAIHKLEEYPNNFNEVAADIQLVAELFTNNVKGNGKLEAGRK